MAAARGKKEGYKKENDALPFSGTRLFLVDLAENLYFGIFPFEIESYG
jgi:hypothetical protein